jgi:Putative beta barrel porin-7 (BBP7)
MRMSCLKLCLIRCLACMACLAPMATSAQAQFGCSGNGPAPVYGGPMQQQGGDAASATTLPNDGSPNAFSDPLSPCWTNPLVWGNAQYLVGITRRTPLNVPLVTTSTNTDTSVGAIGEDGTQVLYGLEGLDLQNPQGMRFTLGFSPTRAWRVPFEVVYTYMHQTTAAFAEQSDANGNPVLARPIFSTQPDNSGEKSLLASFPGLQTGAISVGGSLQLWGLQAVGVVQPECKWGDDCCGCSLYLPVGFRYLNLNEGLTIINSTTSISPDLSLRFLGSPFGQGSQTIVTDIFKANNEFRGGEFGLRFETHQDAFSLTLEPRISIGATHQAATITGVSVLNPADGSGTQTASGGILALPSNSGRFSRERFTYLPEGTVTLRWQCFRWLGVQAGYNITYWPNVQRSGNEITNRVDPRQIPTAVAFDPTATPTSPTFIFKESNFWMQDLSFGIVFSY